MTKLNKVSVAPVKSIMTTDVITVNEDTPVYEAMNILERNQISGVPVVDSETRVVGILTEKDVLEILLNSQITGKDTVSKYMTRKVICFTENDSAMDICDFFIKTAFRRVPIVRDGKLVGIVSRRDIISLILDINSKVSNYRFS